VDSIFEQTLFELNERFEEGGLTGEDTLEHALDQFGRTEQAIGAWHFMPDRNALEKHWRDWGARSRSGMKFPVPIGIKDTIDVANMPAERGSAIYSGRIPIESASCVQRLERSGLLALGKTVTTELAYFLPGKTKNPHDLRHTPGGSSSGSAAAVAARVVPVALGSQTAASVIRPAAYCGVVGYVATPGLLSLRGVLPLASSFDSLGIITKFVDDVVFVLEGLAGDRPPRRWPGERPGALLAVDGTSFGKVDDEMLAAFDAALEALAGKGVRIDRASMADFAHCPQLHKDIMAFEAAANFAHEYETFEDSLSVEFRTLLESGRSFSLQDRFEMSLSHREELRRFDAAAEDYDAIIAPAAPGAAPAGLAATGDPVMSRPWQLVGSCQCTLPFASNDSGMPLGVQLVGRRYHDESLLSIAKWMQEALCWTAPLPAFRND